MPLASSLNLIISLKNYIAFINKSASFLQFAIIRFSSTFTFAPLFYQITKDILNPAKLLLPFQRYKILSA